MAPSSASYLWTRPKSRSISSAQPGQPDIPHLCSKALLRHIDEKDRTESTRWIDWNLRSYAEHGHGLWIITTHDGGFLGDCGLTWQTVDDTPALELGYHVKASAQKLGYATEAAVACREYASSHSLASHLVSIIHRDNRASRRVAEKVGMRLDLTLRHSSPVHVIFAMDL